MNPKDSFFSTLIQGGKKKEMHKVYSRCILISKHFLLELATWKSSDLRSRDMRALRVSSHNFITTLLFSL